MPGPTRRPYRPLSQRAWVILGVTIVAAGCPGAKPRGTAPVAKPCATNQDCDPGWACLAARCYDTRKSAAFTHPERQISPDRVRQELELQQQQHLRRMDKELQGLDPPAPAAAP